MKGICKICNKEFTKNSPNQKYCPNCQLEAYKISWKKHKTTYYIKYLRDKGYQVSKEEVGSSDKQTL